MAYFDSGFWSQHCRRVYVGQIRAFERAVLKRFLPAFEGIEDEAERFANEEYERLGRRPGDDWIDMGDLAEQAQEAGIERYEELAGVRQSLLNLSATALFHLFEQQLLLYHRRHILHPSEEDDEALFYRREILKRVREGGVDIERLASWKHMQELEALANTVKHGAGRSAKRLGKLRPDLLVPPALADEEGAWSEPIDDVHLPLAGDDVYVTEKAFKGFADAVVEFWSEFADSIVEADRKNR